MKLKEHVVQNEGVDAGIGDGNRRKAGRMDRGGAVNKTGIIRRSRSDFIRASTLLRFVSPPLLLLLLFVSVELLGSS